MSSSLGFIDDISLAGRIRFYTVRASMRFPCVNFEIKDEQLIRDLCSKLCTTPQLCPTSQSRPNIFPNLKCTLSSSTPQISASTQMQEESQPWNWERRAQGTFGRCWPCSWEQGVQPWGSQGLAFLVSGLGSRLANDGDPNHSSVHTPYWHCTFSGTIHASGCWFSVPENKRALIMYPSSKGPNEQHVLPHPAI